MTRTALHPGDAVEPEDLVSVTEASRRMYISRHTVQHYIDTGMLQARPDGTLSMSELVQLRNRPG